MDGVFQFCMPTDKDYSQRLFHKLNNRDRIDLLTAVINSSGFHADAIDNLNHLLRCYDICTENRNILMHAAFRETHKDVLHLVKKSSNSPTIENEFRIPLAELREVADQISSLISYAADLTIWVGIRKGLPAKYLGSLKMPPVNKIKSKNLREVLQIVPEFATLPKKPPKPRKLTPYQPATNPKGATLPPRSSGA
jgi:hypothetical protein